MFICVQYMYTQYSIAYTHPLANNVEGSVKRGALLTGHAIPCV